MQPVPIVYGMTIGEYAKMLLGEEWLSDPAHELYHQERVPNLKLTVIPCANYTHS